MTMSAIPGPARRFLHVCYCCGDPSPVIALFVEGLAMRNTMTVPTEWGSGSILGLDREVLGGAAFVYDARGPRTSPAVEVQSWIDPAPIGAPVSDATAVGVQALGVSVADLDEATARLTARQCTVVGSGTSPFETRWTTIRDATGVTFDLVEDTSIRPHDTRMRHLRITSSDLSVSLPWYEGLGFEVVGKAQVDDATFLGLSEPVDAQAIRLRLPDESFEAVLVEWTTPRSHGRHVTEPNHAGLFRTAVGVEDTRASYDAMVSAGWVFDRAPMSVELKGTPVPDMWICFLSDPDGVPFEFVERPSTSFR